MDANSSTAFQKTLLGIAISFYVIYKLWLTQPDIIKNLGAGYPWVMMIWVVVMLFSAGLSGWQAIEKLASFMKDWLKKNSEE